MSLIWWVAGGGALGAGAQYLAVVLLVPRLGWWRPVFALTAIACAILGFIASFERSGNAYGFIGTGFLGALAPFTGLAYSAFESPHAPFSARSVSLFAWTAIAGVAMAILGYLAADIGDIMFEKIPSRAPS